MELTLEEVEARIRKMTPKQKEAAMAATAHIRAKGWIPQPGPQSDAFHSEADELLYGGAAGGGKTDLILGLATTEHERSLIFRAQSTDLDGLWGRLQEITEKRPKEVENSVKKLMKFDGRTIEGGHLDKPGSERSWMGRPHDLIGFDEAAQLDEQKVNFVIQWLRSTTPGQRKRVVMATNPPIPEIKDGVMNDTGVGDWLMRWFAPWIDDTFPDPAEPGELRWCFMVTEGDRLTTIWVEGPGAYDPHTHVKLDDVTPEDIDDGKVAVAKSRTFIKSLLKNNVFLKGTGYAEKLSTTPEPLRSMLLLGDFTVKGEDHPMQVIPTQWVLLAQARWHARQHEIQLKRPRQLVLAGDVAQGGADTTILAPLLETDYFDELTTKPGRDTPTGKEVMAMILLARTDRSLLVLDATGGWAGSTTAMIDQHHDIDAVQFVASKASSDWTPDMVYRYANLRSEMWWAFRLALDPKSEYDICLPPNARLRAQLTTPHWKPKGKLLYIESKDEIRSRLQGSSTDEADAVLMAWHHRDQALADRVRNEPGLIDRIVHGMTAEKMNAMAGQPVELDDPLRFW